MRGALATHYARALADAVFRDGSGLAPENAVAQLRSADEVVSGSKDLQLALQSPAVSRTHKLSPCCPNWRITWAYTG